MFSNSFIQELIKYKSISLLIKNINFLSSFLCIYLILITPKGLNKLSISFLGLINSIAGISISKIDASLENRLNDLQITSRLSSKNLLEDYLQDKNNLVVEVTKKPIEQADIISDIVQYWIESDKHLMIIGGTGDGKSTTVKYFISRLDNYDITAYDVDFSKDDYPERVQIKYTFDDISQSMQNDIELLEARISDRRAEGKNYNPKPKLIIAEELPALALDIDDIVPIWIRKLSSRGRKVKLKLACLAQNDTAENIALKGNVALRDNNFILLYLGSKALEKAKSMKNDALISWLQESKYGRGILNNSPCEINISALSTTYLNTTNTELIPTSKTPESTGRSETSAPEVQNLTSQNDGIYSDLRSKSEQELIDIGRVLKSDGYSKTKIIKLLFNIDGGSKFTELSRKLDDEND